MIPHLMLALMLHLGPSPVRATQTIDFEERREKRIGAIVDDDDAEPEEPYAWPDN